ncbi:MAG: imidazolonepropionase [Bacteroidales bacterium]
MRTLIKNIKKIVGIEYYPHPYLHGEKMDQLHTIDQGWLMIEDQRIHSFGHMHDHCPFDYDVVVDATGQMLFPCFCDSHTHIVYAGSREQEFVDKLKGLSYVEIARRGGGILNSAERLHHTSEEELYHQAMKRVDEMIRFGTGAIEIKSGYGLTLEDEIKMLRVIRRIKESAPVTVKSTFLGAHAVPAMYKERQSEYVDLIVNVMIPAIAREGLADYIDVFCDEGFFTVEETDRMLKAAARFDIFPKIHANELARSGGIQVGVQNQALSVDHLEFTGEEELMVLQESVTMPTLLPGAAFFLEMDYPPARKIIDSGLPVALASDYNPGSAPSGNMKFILSLACIKMKMTPNEAINAATINSAYAMGLSLDHGSIAKGKLANVFLTKPIPSVEYFPYAFTSDLVDRVILRGEFYD